MLILFTVYSLFQFFSQVNNTSSSIGTLDILTTGVTTRLQREQQQKTQENPQNSSTATSTTTTTTTTTTSSVSTAGATTIVTTSTTPLSSSTSSICLTTDSVIASTTATTTSVLSTTTSSVTTSSTTTNVKDNREINKENKENKLEPKETHLIKVEVKEEPQLSSETGSGKDVKVMYVISIYYINFFTVTTHKFNTFQLTYATYIYCEHLLLPMKHSLLEFRCNRYFSRKCIHRIVYHAK